MTVLDLRPPAVTGPSGRDRAEVTPVTRTRRSRTEVVAIVERSIAFFVPLAAFLAFAYDLVIIRHSQIGDAVSRMANGYYVFDGKDPHLAAIGFVWQPLQTIIDMPFILFRGFAPDLTRLAFGANIASSCSMAGASYQAYRFFEERGIGRLTRWLLLAGLLVNPIVFDYAGNGMSEALFIFTLVATTRYLVTWLETGATRPLLISAVWLGLAYADRNEAASAAIFATALVVVVSYRRSSGDPGRRRHAAFTDASLYCLPFALVFLGWAITSKIISGSFFDQFSSIYGTTAQLAAQHYGSTHADKLGNLHGAIGVTLAFAPAYPVMAVLALIRAWRTRQPAALAVLAVLGGVVAFEVATFTLGKLAAGQERYFIYAIPMLVLLAACLAAPLPKTTAERRNEHAFVISGRTPRYLAARRRQRRLLSGVLALVAVASVVPGIFTTWHEMFRTSAGTQDYYALEFVVHPGSKGAEADPNQRVYPGILREDRYLDTLHLKTGQLMLDNFDSCIPGLIMSSDDPDQFEIPNDQHFYDLFGVPYAFGIRYILVPNPAGALASDNSINRNYPDLYSNGTVAGVRFGTLVQHFNIPACGQYRLYKLLPGGNSLG